MRKLYLLTALCLLFAIQPTIAQTVLINPNGDGGFETGSTFAANGWTVVNSATANASQWFLNTTALTNGSYSFTPTGSRSAYISNNGGTNWRYNTSAAAGSSHFYRDVTFPAGQTINNLSFRWIANGESTWDILYVYLCPATLTPVANSPSSNTTTVSWTGSGSATLIGSFNLQSAGSGLISNLFIPASVTGNATSASNMRIVFTWKNDGSGGSEPPAAIDDISLVSNAPLIPASGGTFTIDSTQATSGTNFRNFTDAITHLNAVATLTGSVTFNVVSGQSFTEDAPAITASGASGIDIIFKKSGAGANPVIIPNGTSGSTDAGITISGGDYIKFDGIDIRSKLGSSAVEYGYFIRNATATNGAQFITIQNSNISLNRSNTSSRAIYQNVATTPTSAAGANSNNKYYNLTISNVYAGIQLSGNATYPDLNTEIGTTNSTTFNIIGDAATLNDIGNGSTQTYGIRATNQSGFKIYNNAISNVTGSAVQTDGIFIETFAGNCVMYNNKITGIRNSSTTSTTVIAGIRASHTTTGTHSLKIYNNFISNITSAYTGTASSTRVLRGINLTSTTGSTTTYEIDHNSVRIDGTASPNISSSCFEIANAATYIVKVRNNIFSNFTTAQSGVAKHYAWVTASATAIGGTGSVSDYNDLYIDNLANGFIGLANTTDKTTLTDWKGVATNDANSISALPLFVNSTDLHINTSSPTALEAAGTTIATINTDIDGDTRPGPAGSVNGGGTASDIGADEFDGRKLVAIDIRPDSLITPAGKICNNPAVPVRVKIRNAGTSALDFAVNNLTVNATVTGAASANFTASLNTGTLAPDAATYIDLSPTVSMMNSGDYNFTIIAQLTGDLAASNDTLRATASVDTAFSLPQIVNFTGYTGTPASLSTAFPGWNEGSGAVTPVIGGDGSFTSTATAQQTFYGGVGAKMNLYNTNVGWIISPKFVPTSNHKFKYKAAVVGFGATNSATLGTNDTVRAVVSTDCGVTWTTLREFTAASSNGLGSTNALTAFEEDLSAYAGQPIRVAIYARRTPTSTTPDIDIVIDDVAIDLPTLCFEPTALTLSTLEDTTATITWTDPTTGTPANGYQIYISNNSTVPTASTVPTYTGVNVANYTFNGLQPNTTYYVWIRSNCGTDGNSLWSNPITFKTFCTTVTTFTENFDAVSTSVFPECWSKVGTTGSAYLQTTTPNSSPNTLYIYSSSTSSKAVVAMPPVSNLDAGTHRLRFKARASSTVGGVIEVGYLTNPSDASTFTTLSSITASALTYQDYEVIPSGSTGGAKVMAFRHTGSPANSVLIDDVKWEALPTCEVPNTLVKSNLTHNAITINWNAPSVTSPVNYDVYYSVSNTAPTASTTPSITAITNTSTDITNLNSSTKYYFWVRSFCGGSEYSLWTNIDSFTTNCSPVTSFPWTENFESVTTPALPSCFTAIDVNNDGDKWITYTTYGVSGSNAAGLYTDFNNGANNDYLVLPSMTLTGNQRLRFSVRARSTTEPNDYQVVLSTTGNSPAEFTNVIKPLTTVSSTTHAPIDWIDLSAYNGTVYIAIHVPQGGADGYYLYVDDITVENIPTCEMPTAFVKSNLTANSVTLDWTAPSIGTPVSYDVHYSTTNTAPTGSTTPTNPGIAINSTTISNLTANTKYYYWIRSFCGGSDYSGWSAVDSFTTLCNSVTAFSENFDGVSASVFPSCWYKVGTTGTANLQTSNPNSAPNTLYIYSSTTSSKAVVAMPPVSNLDAGTHRLKFKARANLTVGGVIEVGYLTNPLDASTFTLIASVTASTLTYQDYQVIPTGTTNASILAFRHSGSPANSVLIDDVSWEAIPTCEVPNTFVKSNLTYNAVTVSWNAPAVTSPVSYDVYYSVSNTAPTASTTPSITAITNTSTDITNLNSSTKYYFWVRSFCGGADYSLWGKIDSFTTTCSPITTFPWTENFESVTTPALPSCFTAIDANNDGDKWITYTTYGVSGSIAAGLYTDGNGGANNDYLVLPPMTLTGNQRLRFSVRARSTTEPNDYRVVLSTTGIAPADFTNVIKPLTSVSSTTHAQIDWIDLSAYTGTVYIAIHVPQGGADGYYLYVDDIRVENIPTCEVPTTFVKSDITVNSITLNWTAPVSGNPATNYDLYYSPNKVEPTGSTTPSQSGITGTTFTISNLTENTKYYFWVRTFCGGADYSLWTVVDSFNTACNPTNVPYTQNFETATAPSLPNCTNQQNVGTGNNWIVVNNPGSTFLNNTLQYTYNTANAANVWFFTQGINLVGGTPYTLTFKYGNNSTTYTEKLKVKYGSSPAATDMTDSITDIPSIKLSGSATSTTDFTPAVSGVYYIGFQAYSSANQWHLYLDDISLNVSTILPVTIAEFTGKREGSVNKLQWITATEVNNAGFEVERSTDGNNFSKIAFVASQAVNGNSNSKLVYNMIDETVLSGGAYYRLKQLDKDGKSQYSKVIHIKGALTTKLDIVNLYPNPVKHVLNVAITAPSSNKVRFVITDLSGRTVAEESRMIAAGENIITLNTTAFIPGTYIIKAVCADGCETAVRKFIKQ